jgi:perosamine synthetase
MRNPSKYTGNELKYLGKVLDSENWSATSGGWNNSFEKKFAEKFNAKYCISMNSGTSTLHAALEAAGVGYGDEVISPALTVIMDTSATIHSNAIPVYADIDPETFNIDAKDIEKKITPKTKAIIVVSLYGLPADMDPIMSLANKNGLIVIEDNAQCFLGTYKGRMTGTIGHMSSYSFENTKHISCGEGGAVITNNELLAERVRKIGGHGFRTLRAEEGRIRLRDDEFQNPHYKRHDTIGWNYRMPEFNAAVALAQLERLDEMVSMRQESAKLFIDIMDGCKYLTPQKCPKDCVNSYYTLGVVYDGAEKIGVSWENFRSEYKKMGGDGFYGAWSVPYLEPVMLERQFSKRCPAYELLKYQKGLCPVAERIQPKIMQFKTNYRSLDLAREKANALKKTIDRFGV